MIKLLYIPTGEYLRFYSYTNIATEIDISILHDFTTVNEFISKFFVVDSLAFVGDCWKKDNNIVKFPMLKEEIVIIYD